MQVQLMVEEMNLSHRNPNARKRAAELLTPSSMVSPTPPPALVEPSLKEGALVNHFLHIPDVQHFEIMQKINQSCTCAGQTFSHKTQGGALLGTP